MEEEICEEIIRDRMHSQICKIVSDVYGTTSNIGVMKRQRMVDYFNDKLYIEIQHEHKKFVPHHEETVKKRFRKPKTKTVLKAQRECITYATIDIDDKVIKIYRNELYTPLKKFGEEHNFKKLIKCWNGVHLNAEEIKSENNSVKST